MAEALTEHDGIGRLNAVDDSAEIDVDDSVPRLDRVIAQLAPSGDSRIVEDVVEASVLLRYALDQAPEAIKVRNSHGEARGGPPSPTSAAPRHLSHFWLQLSEDHRGPSSGKLLRKCAADARSRTRNDRHGTVEDAKVLGAHRYAWLHLAAATS